MLITIQLSSLTSPCYNLSSPPPLWVFPIILYFSAYHFSSYPPLLSSSSSFSLISLIALHSLPLKTPICSLMFLQFLHTSGLLIFFAHLSFPKFFSFSCFIYLITIQWPSVTVPNYNLLLPPLFYPLLLLCSSISIFPFRPTNPCNSFNHSFSSTISSFTL